MNKRKINNTIIDATYEHCSAALEYKEECEIDYESDKKMDEEFVIDEFLDDFDPINVNYYETETDKNISTNSNVVDERQDQAKYIDLQTNDFSYDLGIDMDYFPDVTSIEKELTVTAPIEVETYPVGDYYHEVNNNYLSGIAIWKQHRSHYFTVLAINHRHPDMFAFKHINIGDRILSVNNMSLDKWKNEEMHNFLLTERVTSLDIFTQKMKSVKRKQNSKNMSNDAIDEEVITNSENNQQNGTADSEGLISIHATNENCAVSTKYLSGIEITKKERFHYFTIIANEHKHPHRCPFTEVNIGDYVLSLNQQSLINWTNEHMSQYLQNTQIIRMEIRKKTHQTENIEQSMLRNGIAISKCQKSKNFTVTDIDASHIIMKNYDKLALGDKILKINNEAVAKWTNKKMKKFLENELIESIQFESPKMSSKERYIAKQKSMLPIQLEWSYSCEYCGCVYLSTASVGHRKLCCQEGELSENNYLDLIPYPDEFINLVSIHLPHLGRSSTIYNNMLSMCATGVENDHGGGFENFVAGTGCVTMNGKAYHALKPATNSTNPSGGISYFTFDSQAAMYSHAEYCNKGFKEDMNNGIVYDTVKKDLLIKFKTILDKYNKYAQELKSIGDQLTECAETARRIVPTILGQLEYFEVAQITSESPGGNRILTVQFKNQVSGTKIDMDSSEMEPLSYPLLFLYGEDGWGKRTKGQVSFIKYLASRLLMPDKTSHGEIWLMRAQEVDENGKERFLKCNRFQVFSRLGQTYFVDMVSRAIDFKIDWVSKNQNTIFAGNIKDAKAISEEDDSDYSSDEEEDLQHSKNNTYLPSSFFGSKRYMKKKSLSALAIVSELGPATGFLTLTCNVDWPEIKGQLLDGENAFECPKIVCQAFHDRLAEFLKLLENGDLFPSPEMELDYIIRVIEFQHRGLPHAHVVYKIKGINGFDPDLVDEMISAEMPPESEDEYQKQYLEAVRKHMQHKCTTAVNGCKKSPDSKCKRRYSDDSLLNAITHINEKGYIEYRRRTARDRRTVPHSPIQLIIWDGHICLEWAAGGAKSILYLYPYLYKGPKNVRVNFEEINNEDETTELSLYLKGRFLCSMDAIWRILGYKTYPSSKPRVKVVKVKCEDAVNFNIQQLQKCDLQIYFLRPKKLQDLKFTELFESYIVCSILPKRYEKEAYLIDEDFFAIYIKNLNQHIFLCKRKPCKYKTIVRMEMLYLKAGDLWYLRLILLATAPTSFEDAQTHDGVLYTSFQQAAIVEDINETKLTFQELIYCCKPPSLRSLFCIHMIEGFPMLAVFDDPFLRQALIADFMEHNQENEELSINMFLLDLKHKLEASSGKSLGFYGFEEPLETDTELDREYLKIQPNKNRNLLNEMMYLNPNNEGQQKIYETVMDLINDPNPLEENHFIMIHGPAGVGKTDLCKKLQAASRANGHLIKICASTTLAATLYEGAETAHSLFKFPVVEENEIDEESTPQCKLAGTDRLKVLQHCRVIFWDEFVSNDRQLFESVINVFKQFYIKVIFVCSGDFRQILPVINHGTTEDIIGACISSSPHWKKFKVFHLVQNMRLTSLQKGLSETATQKEKDNYNEQLQYNASMLAIAQGEVSEQCKIVESDEKKHLTTIALSGLNYFKEEEQNDALAWLYPNGFNSESAVTNCILAATNEAGDRWNNIIQDMNESEERTYYSKDKLCDVDDPYGYLKNMLSKEVLNDIKPNQVPSHSLKLKVNDVCLILRHLKALDIATNQRVKILGFLDYCVKVETIEANPRIVYIPRIRFKFSINEGDSFKMMRTQFPFRLAYCMTYNKSQGQTLGKVLLDITHEPFSHGHCYVSLSRVRQKDDIRLYITNDRLLQADNGESIPLINNIVYKHIIPKV